MSKKPVAQVVLEHDRAISNVLLGGPGGNPVYQREATILDWSHRMVAHGANALSWEIGLAPVNFPLRAIYAANWRLVFLLEYPPGMRTMPWIREDSKRRWGAGVTYRDATIALPYVLFFITTTRKGQLHSSSVYFRTEPLTKSDYSDALLDCHFLNCSVDAFRVHCWICTQHMEKSGATGQSLLEFVAAIVENFWFAASNLSSEDHEGASFFSRGTTLIPDARVRTIHAWESASAADPRFALQVPWSPADRTVRDVFRELTGGETAWPFTTATQLESFILQPPKP